MKTIKTTKEFVQQLRVEKLKCMQELQNELNKSLENNGILISDIELEVVRDITGKAVKILVRDIKIEL